MKFIYLLILFCVTMCVVNALKDLCDNVKTSVNLLRMRRHLTFPKGTAFIITLSVLKAIMVHAPSGWNLAAEIDVIFPMASPEMLNAFYKKKNHHRQRREFWEKLQHALDSYNFNGRSCTYRTICEAKFYLAPPGKSLVHDILRVIFKYIIIVGMVVPFCFYIIDKVIIKRAPLEDEKFKEEISDAYQELLEPDFCERAHDCPVSIIDMILTLNKNVD